MNTSILRTALAIAIVLGIGVIANIFGNHGFFDRGPAGAAAARPGGASNTMHAASGQTMGQRSQKEISESVRRHLHERGYLAELSRNATDDLVQAAILAFEFDHNLPLTASPTEPVLKALIFTHAKVAPARSDDPPSETAFRLITNVQRALAHLGYADQEPSGKLDRNTRNAIRKFERARGLQPSGRLSAPLIESLGPAFQSTSQAGETSQAAQPMSDAG